MTAKQIIKMLKKEGWKQVSQKGSHKKFKHSEKPGLVIVPDHGNTDLAIGTLKSIYKQAGMK